MRKIGEKKWSPHILSKSTLVTNGNNYMCTYDLNNGQILKLIKPKEDMKTALQYGRYEEFIKELFKKLQLSKEFNIAALVLPNTIYFNKKDELIGYTMPKIKGDTIDNVLSKITSLELYSKIFEILIDNVIALNEEGIILPDLANTSNILISKNLEKIHFIDYDGMQVQDSPSFVMSGLLNHKNNPMLNDRKYRKNDLFTKNLDKLSLLLIFVYYTTGKNFMCRDDLDTELLQQINSILKQGIKLIPNTEEFTDFFNSIGINNTELSNLIERIFNPQINNLYPKNAIKKLVKTHDISSSSNVIRTFMRK